MIGLILRCLFRPFKIMQTAPREVLVLCAITYSFVLALLIGSMLHPSIKEFAFQLGLLQPLRGWPILIVVLVGVIGLITCAARATNVKPERRRIIGCSFGESMVVYYPIWGFAQQVLFFLIYVLLNYITGDLLLSKVLLVLAFMLFHFPNWFLLFSPGLMILMFAIHFDRYYNLYAVGIAHGWIASTLEYYSPRAVSTSYTTWFRYIRAQKAVDRLLNRRWRKL